MLQTHGGIAGVQRTRDNEKDQDPAGRRVGGVLVGDTDGGSVMVLVEPGIAVSVPRWRSAWARGDAEP